ncbi:nucleotidyltransferase domain-containing protein [Magnetococcus sp. PR-3]|uniref:nucleotidyltransferase domain-containing protein n=1 Tax=Magnetococcus sp. PR-3 TaxID=3120355 RepID=UPI002FCE2286
MNDGSELLAVLRQPEYLLTLPPAQQEPLLRLLRIEGLLAHVGARLQAMGHWSAMPEDLQGVFLPAMAYADDRRRMLLWEVNRIRRSLRHLHYPLMLLKGAAYAILDLPNARGRLVADVDIMLPRQDVEPVEQALLAQGWEGIKMDAYDQHYYRQWMHEIPPLIHTKRNVELDIHHTILPLTSRLKPDVGALWAAADLLGEDVEPQYRGLLVLRPTDMVLHAVVHLFQEDLHHGLRGLVDIHLMLCHFGEAQKGFWEALVPRAERLDLGRPLYYALYQCHQLLDTPIPQSVLEASQADAPPAPIRSFMNRLMTRLFTPRLRAVGREETLDIPARFFMYIRAHWLRMPPGLLLKHLSRKSTRRWGPDVWTQRNP